jgi:hypothetical protein
LLEQEDERRTKNEEQRTKNKEQRTKNDERRAKKRKKNREITNPLFLLDQTSKIPQVLYRMSVIRHQELCFGQQE